MTILLNAITKATTDAAAVFSQAIKVTSPPGAGAQYAKRTFLGVLRNSGAVASTATITVQVTNDALAESNPTLAGWITMGTISLSGTPSATGNVSDGFATDATWMYVRATIAQNGITGTGAVASLIMGA
jgi:hypothetical protein